MNAEERPVDALAALYEDGREPWTIVLHVSDDERELHVFDVTFEGSRGSSLGYRALITATSATGSTRFRRTFAFERPAGGLHFLAGFIDALEMVHGFGWVDGSLPVDLPHPIDSSVYGFGQVSFATTPPINTQDPWFCHVSWSGGRERTAGATQAGAFLSALRVLSRSDGAGNWTNES